MNKDSRNGLSQVEKAMLVISDDQLYREILLRKQLYFNADESDHEQVKTKKDAVQLVLKCAVCGKVPLQLETCKVCEDCIVCRLCQLNLRQREAAGGLTDKEEEMKACEMIPRPPASTFPCLECDADFVPFDKLKSSKKLVKDLMETHSCAIRFGDDQQQETPMGDDTPGMSPQDDETIKRYDIAAMLRHINEECPKTRTCYQCRLTFDTNEDFATHLKYTCQHIKVRCNLCDKDHARNVFTSAEHHCYSSGKQ